MSIVVLTILGLLLVGLATLGGLVVAGWIDALLSGQRQRAAVAAERRLAEYRLQRLTSDAVQQLLAAARDAADRR
jgi:hypothetical protein